jgi:hypothetical protein
MGEILCVATFDTICSSKFGTIVWTVVCQHPMQLGNVLGDIYYQKKSNQNKNKAKHYAQDFFEERKQVFHKNPKKTNKKKKNKCLTKKLTKNIIP